MVAFSVLIPVFNSEEHLQECVDSVLNQTFQNFEIILIDDGSTDRSGDICEKYSALDKRIEVIRQRNQGPTIARIAAFQRASGRYVIYMDSDDLWDEQLLEKVQKAIEKYNCDIVSFRWKYIDCEEKDIKEIPSIYSEENTIYDIRTLMIKFLTEEVENSLWKRAVRKNCIDPFQIASLSAIKDIYLGEDMVQSFIMIKDCTNMVYLDQPLYHYRLNPKGLTHDTTPRPVIDVAMARQYLWEIIGKSKFNLPEYKKMLAKSFWERYLTDLVNIAALYNMKVLKETATKIRNQNIYVETKKKTREYDLSIKRKILYYLEQSEQWRSFWIIARIYKRLIS